jgi:5'-deoxynucleotidase YfbR-like HD superfamily hydrolase
MAKKYQTWFQTYSGVKFDPRNVRPKDIVIEDIAHALSMICRFGGHTEPFYSVASHCNRCAEVVFSGCQAAGDPLGGVKALQALLHDASEAYLCDIVKPVKVLIPEYSEWEDSIWCVISKKFGVPEELFTEVRLADFTALATEKRDLVPDGPEWTCLRHAATWVDTTQPEWPGVAEERFLRNFRDLNSHIKCQNQSQVKTSKRSLGPLRAASSWRATRPTTTAPRVAA